MRTLLLDKVFRPISFINFRKLIRLYFSNKIEVMSSWTDIHFYGKEDLPSIVRLTGENGYVRRKPIVPRFTFKGVFKRDLFTCQFSGKSLPITDLTIDHIIPKSRGGKSTWENCVTASLAINSAKGNKTPEEAGLKIIRKPEPPKDVLELEFSVLDVIHEDWLSYFPNLDILGKDYVILK